MLGRMFACRATHRTRRLPPEAQAETCQARAAELAQAVNLSSLSRESMWSRRNVRRTSRAGSTRTRRVRSKTRSLLGLLWRRWTDPDTSHTPPCILCLETSTEEEAYAHTGSRY